MAYNAALRRYEEQYDALKAELQTLGFVGQGGVHTRRITCGRATCRCHDDPDARHGPYHYWTRKARGKTVGLNLTEDELVLSLFSGWPRKIHLFGLYFLREYGISLVWSTSTGCPATNG